MRDTGVTRQCNNAGRRVPTDLPTKPGRAFEAVAWPSRANQRGGRAKAPGARTDTRSCGNRAADVRHAPVQEASTQQHTPVSYSTRDALDTGVMVPRTMSRHTFRETRECIHIPVRESALLHVHADHRLLFFIFGFVTWWNGPLTISVPQQRYLALSALSAISSMACAWATNGYASAAFVAAPGFVNAAMWPAIFSLAIKGLGRPTESGSALLIMGIMGGAALPPIYPCLAESIDFRDAFLFVMAPGYAYILFHGAFGYRVGQLQPGRTPQPGSAKG